MHVTSIIVCLNQDRLQATTITVNRTVSQVVSNLNFVCNSVVRRCSLNSLNSVSKFRLKYSGSVRKTRLVHNIECELLTFCHVNQLPGRLLEQKKNNRKTWAEYTREKSVLKNNVGQYISFLQSWYTNHIRSWWARSAEWRWCCMTGYRAQWANQMSAGMSMPTVSVCTISSTPQMQNVNDKINKISTINIIAKLRIEIHFLPFHTVTALHYQMKTWMIHYSSNVVSILSYVLKVRCAVAVKIHMEANPTQPQIIGLIKDLLFQLANFFAERFRPL